VSTYDGHNGLEQRERLRQIRWEVDCLVEFRIETGEVIKGEGDRPDHDGLIRETRSG
jgi:hypothetical protein